MILLIHTISYEHNVTFNMLVFLYPENDKNLSKVYNFVVDVLQS